MAIQTGGDVDAIKSRFGFTEENEASATYLATAKAQVIGAQPGKKSKKTKSGFTLNPFKLVKQVVKCFGKVVKGVGKAPFRIVAKIPIVGKLPCFKWVVDNSKKLK